MVTAGLMNGVGPAWSETAVLPSGKPGIVAAGFGYQSDDDSTITVKMYDPLSGEVLSDETFELNVKDESSNTGGRRPRIFAGGVGPGATDLSNFMVRVYDAQTGAFQWEGQLNLTPAEGADAAQLVSTVTPRRVTVSKVLVSEPAVRQPSFLIRALDSATGGLVWEDEFSTDGVQPGRIEPVVGPKINHSAGPAIGHRFDFRVRMRDAGGHVLLWEDRFAAEEDDEDAPDPVDDHATMLPMWPRLWETDRLTQPISI